MTCPDIAYLLTLAILSAAMILGGIGCAWLAWSDWQDDGWYRDE
jgi:hypothetical protein